MEILQATTADLDGILSLHRKYHIDSIDAADKPDGFVTTNFSQTQIENLVGREKGVTIAVRDDRVVAYAMAASWSFWSEWPFYRHMIAILPEYHLEGQPLSITGSYQYGPICIDGAVRGTGVFEKVFHASLRHMSARYPVMVTFINTINHRSYSAHTSKTPLRTVGNFHYNNNEYSMLACATQ